MATYPRTLAQAATTDLSGTYASYFIPQKYGAKADGTTDDTAAIQACVQACYDANGGTIYFPQGTYLVLGNITVPNDGGTPRGAQPAMRMMGAGAAIAGNPDLVVPKNSAATLDMRSSTGPACLDTRGYGLLHVEGLTFRRGGGGSTQPFIQTTNTTLHVRGNVFCGDTTLVGPATIQDAIVLGGNTGTSGNLATSSFAGYGTVIENNQFSHVRRWVYLRERANANIVAKNWGDLSCGASSAAAAIEMDGTASECTTNIVAFNTIEVGNYVYAVKCIKAGHNRFVHNSIWDEQSGVGGAGGIVFAAFLRCENAGSSLNEIDGLKFGAVASTKIYSDDGTPGGQVIRIDKSWVDGLGMNGGDGKNVVKPNAALPAASSTILGIYRSAAEGTLPSAKVFDFQNSGWLDLDGTFTAVRMKNSGTNIFWFGANGTSTVSLTRYAAGQIKLDPLGGGQVDIASGTLRLPRITTASRPAAATAANGSAYFDTTLSKPVYSDGTNWRLFADDTIV